MGRLDPKLLGHGINTHYTGNEDFKQSIEPEHIELFTARDARTQHQNWTRMSETPPASSSRVNSFFPRNMILDKLGIIIEIWMKIGR